MVAVSRGSGRGGVVGSFAWRSNALGGRTPSAFASQVFGNTSGRACGFEQSSCSESAVITTTKSVPISVGAYKGGEIEE